MSEVGTWDILRPVMVGLNLDPVRVENVLGAGTPDVNYTCGWLELKRLDKWPKKSSTIVRIPTLEDRKEQVAFLMRRWQFGPAYLMLQVQREFLMFDGWTSRQVRKGMARWELISAACWHIDRWNEEAKVRLGHWLRNDPHSMSAPNRAKWSRLQCRRTVEEVAADLDWSIVDVLDAELGQTDRTDDLLCYWES